MKDLAEVFQDSDPALKALLSDVGVLDDEEGADGDKATPPTVDDPGEQPRPQATQAAQATQADTGGQDALLQELRELKAALATKDEKPEGKDKDDVAPVVPELKDEDLGSLAAYKDRLEQIAQVGAAKGFKPVVDAVNDLRQQLAQLQEGTNQQQEVLAQQVFVNALRAQVPDVDTIYKSSEFSEFLAQPAPLANGRSIGEVLEEAHNARDVGRIVEIIGMFRAKNGGGTTDPYTRPDIANAAPGMPGSGEASRGVSQGMEKLVDARRRLRKLRAARKITDEEYEQAQRVIQRKEDDLLRRVDSYSDLIRQIA